MVERVPPRVSIWRRMGRAIARAFSSTPGKRAYEGASRSRRFTGWNPSNTSANAEIWASLETLRARARDAERNDPYARRIIDVLAGNLVGAAGLTARASSGSEQTDRRWDALWKRWIKRCDIDGIHGLASVFKVLARALYRDGEALARFRVRDSKSGLEVPLKIEVIEADLLDFWRSERLTTGGFIQHGVEFNAHGERVAYWILPEHPGDTMVLTAKPSERVPAADIVHVYFRERAGQVRGVPRLAVVLAKLRDLGDYDAAERLRKKLEACVMAFITPSDQMLEAGADQTEESQLSPTARAVNADDAILEDMQPGMVVSLRNGKAVTFHTPTAAPGTVENEVQQLRGIGAGVGITYEILAMDLSQTTYSSYRGGQIEFRRQIEGDQWEVFVPLVCERIDERFSETAWLVNKLPTPLVPVEWNTARWQSVDPMKDILAAQAAGKCGFIPLPDLFADFGYHPLSGAKESVAFIDACQEIGIAFESFPATAPPPADAKEEDGTGPDNVTPLPKSKATG